LKGYTFLSVSDLKDCYIFNNVYDERRQPVARFVPLIREYVVTVCIERGVCGGAFLVLSEFVPSSVSRDRSSRCHIVIPYGRLDRPNVIVLVIMACRVICDDYSSGKSLQMQLSVSLR